MDEDDLGSEIVRSANCGPGYAYVRLGQATVVLSPSQMRQLIGAVADLKARRASWPKDRVLDADGVVWSKKMEGWIRIGVLAPAEKYTFFFGGVFFEAPCNEVEEAIDQDLKWYLDSLDKAAEEIKRMRYRGESRV